jgi:hypothetical protein
MLLNTLVFGFLRSASTGATRIGLWAAVGACAGVFLFFRGFRMLQYKRLILNTPFSKIRSASMGLVEVSGMAVGPQTIPSGITGTPCFYYRATAWELRESGKNREWKKVVDESLCVPFFVEDPTGRMLVNPQGADLDGVHRSFRDELGTSFVGSRDMFPENIAQFLLRNGIGATGNIRLEEHCIQPGYPLFILGSLAENPDRAGFSPQPVNALPASSVSFQLGVSLPTLAGVRTTAAGNSTARKPAPPPFPLSFPRPSAGPAPAQSAVAASNWSSVSMDEVHPPIKRAAAPASASAPEPLAASVSRAPSAAAIALADDPAAIPGNDAPAGTTQTDIPSSDLSVVIGKGAGSGPFTISSESQREVVRSLGWKSAACIWGGPILALISLYILSGIFGW